MPNTASPSHWAVEEVTQKTKGSDNGANVAAAIQEKTARAVCDGSYKDGHGTAGFCIHGDNPLLQVEGCNRTPGRREDQSAYRSELGGVVGTLLTLQSLCSVHKITTGAVELGLDCESAIKKIIAHYPPKVKDCHHDMITECRRLINELPIQVKLRWIESHQDEKGRPLHRLDWWARQNIRMDQKAKRYWKKHKRNPRQAQALAHEMFPITIRGTKLSHLDKELAYELICTQKIKRYWCKKDSIPIERYDDIN